MSGATRTRISWLSKSEDRRPPYGDATPGLQLRSAAASLRSGVEKPSENRP